MPIFSAQSPSSTAAPDDVSALLAQLGITPQAAGADASAYAGLPSTQQAGGAGFGSGAAPATPSSPAGGGSDTGALLAQLGLGSPAAPSSTASPSATAPAPAADPASTPPGQGQPAGDGGPLSAILGRIGTALTGGPVQGASQGNAPPGFIAPPQPRGRMGLLEGLGDVVLGGLPSRILDTNHQRDMAAYQQQAAMAQVQRAYSVVQQAAKSGALAGNELAAAQADPVGYLSNLDAGQKARMTTAMSEGQTFAEGANGSPFYAPKYSVIDGTPVTQAGPLTTTGARLPGKASEDTSGNITDGNTGASLGSVPTFQHFAPGETHGFVQPNAAGQAGSPSGAGGAAPQAGAGRSVAASPVAQALAQRWTAQGVPTGDQAALLATGQLESGLNPRAQNGSSAGLFQFQPATFKSMGGTNISDPGQQADAAAKLWAADRQALTGNLGRAPTDAELYLSHQQGATGATALLRANPSQNAIQALVQGGAYANPAMARRAVTGNGGSRTMTAGDFVAAQAARFAQAQQAVGGGVPQPQAGGPVPGSGALGTENLSGGVGVRQNADGTQTEPDGKREAGPGYFGPEQVQGARKDFYGSDDYKEAVQSVNALNSLTDALRTAAGPNGIIGSSAINNLGRAETGRSMTTGAFKNLMGEIGLPQELEGKINALLDKGGYSQETVQQAYQMLGQYTRTKVAQANLRMANEEANARSLSGGHVGLNLSLGDTPRFLDSKQWYQGAGGGAAPTLQQLLAEKQRRQAATSH